MSGDNDYPTETELRAIRDWQGPWQKLFDYIGRRWKYADWGFKQKPKYTYHLSTAGWSGNEEIIGAMQENFIFWSLCWISSRRGGHYVFQIPAGSRKGGKRGR